MTEARRKTGCQSPLAIFAAALCGIALLATAAPGRATDSPAMREVPVSGLIGLTPPEVFAALNDSKAPKDQPFVSAAWVDGDQLVTVLNSLDLTPIGEDCLMFGVVAGLPIAAPRLRFQNGRLVLVDGSPLPHLYFDAASQATGVQAIRWRCAPMRKRSTDEAARNTIANIMGAPFFLTEEAKSSVLKSRGMAGRAALAELKLGEPVPGGIEAFRRKHDDVVRIAFRSEGTVDLDVEMGERRSIQVDDADLAYTLHARVRDGRVVGFSKGYLISYLPCVLADRTIRCGRRF
jgi:hypothetical protein